VQKASFIWGGLQGKLSRITNHTLTAVSHPLLASIADPGQISYAETQSALYLIGSLARQSFYLFGSPIAHSLFPVLHNSAFAALTLPHTFTPISAGLGDADLVRIREPVSQPDFGGAALANPLKIAAMNLCRCVSHHARVIGAVNLLIPISTQGTPIPQASRNPNSNTGGGNVGGTHGLYGENTDWRGIKTCIARRINPANAVTSSTSALVIGAGGMSRAAIYALHQLGVANILVWNRTRENACDLVDELARRLKDPELGGASFLQLGALGGNLDAESVGRAFSPLPPPTIIISTISASTSWSSAVPAGKEEPPGIGAVPDVGLRRDVLDLSPTGGVAVELAYQPRKTPLLALVDQVNTFPAPLLPPSPLTPTQNSFITSDTPNQKGKQASMRGGHPLSGEKAAPWVAVEGIEILLEQGYEEVRLWTSRRAPQARIRNEVLREFERHFQQGLA
jgi:shikimate 5-dehydrogenase